MTETKTPNTTIAKSRTARPATKEPKTLQDYLKLYEKEIKKALPSQIGADRFARICGTALMANGELSKCSPQSFIGACLNSAQLGLEPNTPLGEAYLIPYKLKVQFQLGYKGLIRLVRNSGEISMIKAQAVHKNDEFYYELGLNPTLKHIPCTGERGEVIAYYAFYKTKDGDFDFEVDTKENIEKHGRKYSQAFSSSKSPWTTDFDAMAKKTLIKRVLKYAPMSTETARKIVTDGTVKLFDAKNEEAMKDLSLVQPEPLEVEYEEHIEEVKE